MLLIIITIGAITDIHAGRATRSRESLSFVTYNAEEFFYYLFIFYS